MTPGESIDPLCTVCGESAQVLLTGYDDGVRGQREEWTRLPHCRSCRADLEHAPGAHITSEEPVNGC